MKVKGIQKKAVEVEIDAYDAIRCASNQWMISIRMEKFYLDGDKWREYVPFEDRMCNDPIIREATVEEIEIYNSFALILEVVKELT